MKVEQIGRTRFVATRMTCGLRQLAVIGWTLGIGCGVALWALAWAVVS